MFNLLNKYKALFFCICNIFYLSSLCAFSNQEFLLDIEKQINHKNYDYFNQIIDVDAVLDKAFRHVETSVKFKNEFSKSVKEELKNKVGYLLLGKSEQLLGAKLIINEFQNTKSSGVFRLDFGEFGVGYIRFFFKLKNNKIKVVDWFDFTTGLHYSDTISSVVRSIAPSPGILGRLKDIGSGKNQKQKQYQKYNKLISNNDYKGLRKLLKSSDESFKTDWILMSGLVEAANLSGDDEFYLEVLELVSKNFAEDERASFMLLDYYFYQEDYEKLLPIVDKFSSYFNHKDAATLMIKATTLIELKKYNLAEITAKRCIDQEQDYENCYWSLVSTAVHQNKFSSVVSRLKTLESKFGYSFNKESFQEEEIYKDFIKSNEFQQWLN